MQLIDSPEGLEMVFLADLFDYRLRRYAATNLMRVVSGLAAGSSARDPQLIFLALRRII